MKTGKERAWLYVALTSFFELVWIFGFNIASAWWHWIPIIIFIFVDFYFLTKACEHLPTGTVYAIFAGVGTVGVAIMDVLFFDQSLSLAKVIFMFIVVIGVMGLNIADSIDEKKAKEGLE